MATVIDRPGAHAEVKFVRMSASKARMVLGLVRGKKVSEALNTLFLSDRLASEAVEKCLKSAVANAEHNEEIPAEELYVAECYADEGPTIKRFRPRARGRASQIQKKTCHIVVKVARYSDDELAVLREASDKRASSSKSTAKKKTSRADRVAKSKAKPAEDVPPVPEEAPVDEVTEDTAEETPAVEAEAPPMPDEPAEEAAAEEPAEEVEEVEEPAAEADDSEDKEEETK